MAKLINLKTVLILLLFSVVISAQDSTSVKLGSEHKKEAVKIDFKPFSNYLIFDLGFGMGLGSGTDIGYGNKSTGFSFYAQIFEIGYGFTDLGNLGFGTMVYEMYAGSTIKEDGKNGLKSAGLPSSWFPFYIYYPLSYDQTVSTYGRASSYMLSPILYLQAGGSMWGTQNNYYNIGAVLQWSFLMPGSSGMIVPYIAGAHIGIFHTPEYSSLGKNFGSKTGFYISFRFGMGAIIPKGYK